MSRKRYLSDDIWYENYKKRLHEHQISNGIELGLGKVRISDFVKNKILSGRTKVLIINEKVILFHKNTEGYWVNNSTFHKEISLHREKYKQEFGLTDEQIKGYEVHHIDGDKNNNEISNLKLLSKEKHAKHHLVETRVKFKKKCDCCGKEYETYINRSRFCSSKCDKRWRRTSGLYNIERECEYCGEKFICYKYKLTKYCSLSCAAKSRYKK